MTPSGHDDLERSSESNQVFAIAQQWFIRVRKGVAVGPYIDKFSADIDAEILKILLADTRDSESQDLIREFVNSCGEHLTAINLLDEARGEALPV